MVIVDGVAVERYRGEAIARMGRNITWGELARKVEMTETGLRLIRTGKSPGSLETCSKLVDAFSDYGLTLSHSDLLRAKWK